MILFRSLKSVNGRLLVAHLLSPHVMHRLSAKETSLLLKLLEVLTKMQTILLPIKPLPQKAATKMRRMRLPSSCGKLDVFYPLR